MRRFPILTLLAAALLAVGWAIPTRADPLTPAALETHGLLLVSLVIERETTLPGAPPPSFHGAGLIFQEANTAAYLPRIGQGGGASKETAIPLDGLEDGQGALHLLLVADSAYAPRQFDYQTAIGRSAAGPICCHHPTGTRVGQITYLGQITMTARGTAQDVTAITLTFSTNATRDKAAFRAAYPAFAAHAITDLPLTHPPVTRYMNDGRFRE